MAFGLTKLSTSAALIGAVGDDAAGQGLVAQLGQAGIDLSGFQQHPTAPTRVVTRDSQGQVLSWGEGEPAHCADAQLQAAALSEASFAAADYLLLGTSALAYPDSAAALARALELADETCTKIFLDVQWQPGHWPDPEAAKAQIRALMGQVDFLQLSPSEAEWLLDTTDAAGILAQLDQLEGVFVVDPDQGVGYALLAGPRGQIPAFKVPVLDLAGAGEAFAAAVLSQLVTNSLQRLMDESFVAGMVRYASAASSLAVTGMGAIAPQASDAEIQAFLVGRVE